MTLTAPRPTFAPRPKRWTKKEYTALVERGALEGQQVYLLRGELIEVAPMGSSHAMSLNFVNMWAARTFVPPYYVRCQSPFETPGESMPEPDVAVVTQSQFYSKPHPRQAMLLIEVSDRSLEIDREKAFDYAAAGVQEYWILDVVGRQLIVHRLPIADPSAPVGFRYDSVQALHPTAVVTPLANPSLTVSVTDFFPAI